MSHSLKVVGKSKKRMYGPRAIMVSGFTPDERQILLKMFKNKKFKKIPVVYTSDKDKPVLVKEMFQRDNLSGFDENCSLNNAIIMSGLTEKEFHFTMSAYKKTKLPKPLFATLTPTSENWTVDSLVTELKNEHLHIEKN